MVRLARRSRSSLAGVLVLATACTANGPAPSTAPEPSPAPSGTSSSPGVPKPDPPPDTTRRPIDPTTDPNAAACTGPSGTIYALNVRRLDATAEIPLCRFQGLVMLIVNTASYCGYTEQYATFEALYEKYRPQGFYVLGFPSQSFEQEASNETTISQFCAENYHITFPLFALGNVNPPAEQPVFTWLKAQPGMSDPIPWNFEKFLISRSGQIVKRADRNIVPDDPVMIAAIEAELAKK